MELKPAAIAASQASREVPMIQMQRHRNINMQILHGVNHDVMNNILTRAYA